jgi:ubiquinone/menaquinone biosynthesis C-methylase UbiE
MNGDATRDSYIHGTEPGEQRRLAALNRMTNEPFVRFLQVLPGERVLEVGSGLGILAAEVAAAAEGVRVVGVEKSPEQIVAAVKLASVTYVQGDAQRLDFPDKSFDLVYARYLLEHVPDREQALREMRRVTRPGGRVAACENDISLLRPARRSKRCGRLSSGFRRVSAGTAESGGVCSGCSVRPAFRR